MSSGEADAIRVHVPNSLDAFVRCHVPVGGCEWHVKLPATLCPAHGGPDGPRYYADSEGAIVAVVHFTNDAG